MEPTPDFDLYAELEVHPGASPETIDAAWRSLVKRHHPDVTAGPDERIRRLNVAHDWLSDPGRRARYDTEVRDRSQGWAPAEAAADRSAGESPADGRSFSERYRGTTWDNGTAAAAGGADPSPTPPSGRSPVRVSAGRPVGLLIGVGLVSAGAIALLVALATLDPFASAPPPRASSPPIVSVTPDPAETAAAVDAFVAKMGGDTAMFHSEASGDIHLDGSVGSLGFEADVHRPDTSGRLTGSLIGSPRDFIHLGKDAWTKSGGGDWTAQPGSLPNRGWDPFVKLGDSGVEVAFQRWETKGTDRLAILRVTGAVALDPLDYLDLRLSDVTVDASEFIVEALADGTPRRATWSIQESGQDANEVGHVVRGMFSYTFSDVGQTVEVSPPPP